MKYIMMDGMTKCHKLLEWCTGKLAFCEIKSGRAMICRICWFSWCKSSHHGSFLDTKCLIPPGKIPELFNNWLSQAGKSCLHNTADLFPI